MRILQTNSFKRAAKKLRKQHRQLLDEAVRAIAEDPEIGDRKAGDLASVWVHKFKIDTQLMLLAYNWDDDTITLTLLALGSHENFYRDLKR